jgi:hypothetical protein
MNVKHQKICFWLGVSFPFIYGIGWAGIAGFLPPLDPSLSAEAIARIYRSNGVSIRVGMAVCLFATTLMAAWATTIWAQLKRIEVGERATLSTFQLGAGITNVVWFMVPTSLWMTAAFSAQFRPQLPAVGIQALNDAAWILWFITYSPATFQCWVLGYVGLQDTRAKPLFPRWCCYVHFWVGLSLFPVSVVPFFVSGPFSWIGVVGFWVPVGLWVVWFALTAWMLYQGILREQAEGAASPSRTASALTA